MSKRFITVVVVKNPALPNREGVLDALRMAMAAAPQQDFNRPPRATNDNQMAWPFISFPEGWYAC